VLHDANGVDVYGTGGQVRDVHFPSVLGFLSWKASL
jgi:hypothetical protein